MKEYKELQRIGEILDGYCLPNDYALFSATVYEMIEKAITYGKICNNEIFLDVLSILYSCIDIVKSNREKLEVY